MEFHLYVGGDKMTEGLGQCPLESDDYKAIADQGGADVIPKDLAYGAA